MTELIIVTILKTWSVNRQRIQTITYFNRMLFMVIRILRKEKTKT